MECQHDDSLLDEFKTINYCICWNNRKGTFGLTWSTLFWREILDTKLGVKEFELKRGVQNYMTQICLAKNKKMFLRQIIKTAGSRSVAR